MLAALFQWCRIGIYLFGAIFCLWFGYWLKNYLIILDEQILFVLRESPYLSFSFSFWNANLTAGMLLCTLLLIAPIPKRRWMIFTIFAVLLLVTGLPLYIHFNTKRFNPDKLLRFSYSLILYNVGIALCFWGLVKVSFTRYRTLLSRFFLWIRDISPCPFLFTVFVNCVVLCSVISWCVFDGVPGYIDSCAYMFQARLFAQGSFYAPLPPEPDFFEAQNILMKGKWYSQYPPGYPALLALGVIFGIPWVINPILGALTIVCIYLLARELYTDSIAKISAVLASISSFFLFMSSEFMAHSSALFFITLAFLSFVLMVKKKRPLLSAVVCGASLGIALVCRPYTTVWICVPLGIAAIVAWKDLSLRYILIGAVPLLVACLAFLAYNYATTGHPLLFGYIALHGKAHYPGFHLDPGNERFHSIAQGFKYLLGNLNALNYYLFEWPIPSLFFACFFLAYGKKRFWEWLLVGWIGVLLVGHFFYYFNQLDFGPRFVYEALPALILLTSRGIVLSTRFLASWQQVSYEHAQNTLFLTLGGLFLFTFLVNVPATAKSYNYGTDITIQKYLDKAEVERALIFVEGKRTYQVHHSFNIPFPGPRIYSENRGSENRRLAEKFPGYRYFIADEKKVIEVSIDEL